MKRKQVVASFLALAMVAGSVANTTPVVVYADPGTNSFGSGLYQEVDVTPHTHTTNCYAGSTQADGSSHYYNDNGVPALVSEGTFIVKDTPLTYNTDANQKVVTKGEDHYVATKTKAALELQPTLTAKFYATKENYKPITAEQLDALAAMDDKVTNREDIEATVASYCAITWGEYNPAADSEHADQYNVISGSAFCKKDGAGAVSLAAIRSVDPLTGTEVVTHDAITYTYASAEQYWTYYKKDETQPQAPYAYDAKSNTFMAEVWREATVHPGSEEPTFTLDGEEVTGCTQGKTDDTKWYKEVSDRYITSLEPVVKTAQNVGKNPLNASVKASTSGGVGVVIDSAQITNDYDSAKPYPGGSESVVTVNKINSGLKTVIDANNNHIIDDGEVVALSDLDAEQLKALNGGKDITFEVYNFSAPTISISDSDDAVDGYPVYEAVANAFTVTTGAGWNYTYQLNGSDATLVGNQVDLSAANAGRNTFTVHAENKNVPGETTEKAFVIFVLKADAGKFDEGRTFTYDGNPIKFKYIPSAGQLVTYKYCEAGTENYTEEGLPTAAGSYDVQATIAASKNNGYKETVKTVGAITINRGTDTQKMGTEVVVQSGEAIDIDLSSLTEEYPELENKEIMLTSNKAGSTKLIIPGMDEVGNVTTSDLILAGVTVKTDSAVEPSYSETLTGTIHLTNVDVEVQVIISVEEEGNERVEVSARDVIVKHGVPMTEDDILTAAAVKVGDSPVAAEDITLSFDTTGSSIPTAVGESVMTIFYKKGQSVGSCNVIYTVEPVYIKLVVDNITVAQGGTPQYVVKAYLGETLIESNNYGTYFSVNPSVVTTGINLNIPGTYDLIPTATVNSGYEIHEAEKGTLTVTATEYTITLSVNVSTWGSITSTPADRAAMGTTVTLQPVAASGYEFDSYSSEGVTVTNNQFVMPRQNVTITANFKLKTSKPGGGNNNPGGGSPITGSGSTTTTDKPADTKPTDTKPTDKPADTTPTESNTITTNKDGAQIIVGTDGAPVENKVVIIGNDKYITNDEGVIVKNDFASTAKGNKVFTDADGKIVTDKTIVVDGKKYVAKESGALAVSEVVTTAKGNKVYCDATGAVVTDKTIKVDGKKYVAKENGVLAVSEMVTTAKGNKVYCGKTGAIVTGKSFKVDGKRYVASKTGAIVTSKWVKVGDKAYYCDKNGVVTKVKPAKKK